jgi:hypothetical protein
VQQALPLKAVATDADTVADGTPVRLHDVEKPLGRMNDDRAGSLGGAVKNGLAPKLQRQLFIGSIGNVAWLVADRHVLALCKSVRHRNGKGRQQDDLETEEAKQQHLGSRIGIEWCQLHKIQFIRGRQGRRVMSY